jgi:hypothetical protein
MRWARHVTSVEEMKNSYRVVVKRQRKGSLGRPSHRWEDNMKMDLKEIECGGVDWIQLAQDSIQWWAIVIMVINPLDFIKNREFLDQMSNF